MAASDALAMSAAATATAATATIAANTPRVALAPVASGVTSVDHLTGTVAHLSIGAAEADSRWVEECANWLRGRAGRVESSGPTEE